MYRTLFFFKVHFLVLAGFVCSACVFSWEDKMGQDVFIQEEGRVICKTILRNGLRVLIISDPAARESSAAVSVEAGSWDDPVEHQGMAHFVEHLLFLGTKSFPVESELRSFIKEGGGECSATTFCDKTVYGFCMRPHFFVEGLKRFSELFMSPLFMPCSIEREKNALQHEFEDTLENNVFRIWRIFQETGNNSHPNKQFSSGNRLSLQETTKKDVEHWFYDHYRPDKMCLVLMSSEPIEQLTKLAYDFFGDIQCPDKEPPSKKRECEETLMSLSQKGHLIYIKPVFHERSLSLLWEVPKLLMRKEKEDIFSLVNMLITEGNPNNLCDILHDMGLATGVQADFWKVEKEHGIFLVNITLTQQGAILHEEVIAACFAFFNAMKEKAISILALEQLRKKQKGAHCARGYKRIMSIAEDLIEKDFSTYPDERRASLEEVIQGVYALFEYLHPKTGVSFLIAPREESLVKPSRVEQWMREDYYIRQVEDQKLEDWTKAIFHKEDCESKCSLDTEIEEAFFYIKTPMIQPSLENRVFNKLFIEAVEGVLQKELQGHPCAGWHFREEEQAFCITLHAPKEIAREYYSRFFSILLETKISQEMFTTAKERLMHSYVGDPNPLRYAEDVFFSYFTPPYYTSMEFYRCLETISYEAYQIFSNVYLQKMVIAGPFLGEGDTEEIEPFLFLEEVEPKEASIPFSFFQNTHRKGNAIVFAILTLDAEEEMVFHRMLGIALEGHFFRELRTNQQVAYKLHHKLERIGGYICHCFSVQSSTHSPIDLAKRIEGFLEEFAVTLLTKIPLDRFLRLKELVSGDKDRIDPFFVSYEGFLQKTKSFFDQSLDNKIVIHVFGD